MHTPMKWMLAAGLALALAACGTSGSSERGDDDGDTATDTSNDAENDTDDDVSVDPGADPVEDTTDVGPDTSVDFGDCSQTGHCTLREPQCCGSCTDLDLSMLEPVSIDYNQEFFDSVCPEPIPPCPACETPPPPPELIAACEQGTCVEYDIRESFHTECTEPADCMVIWSDCCQCGPNFIALATEARPAYLQAVCDPRADCIDCPRVEPTADVDCVGGRCMIVDF